MAVDENIFRGSLRRWTDLPYQKWWGLCVRFFKTIEVSVFKILQSLDLYRPQKSIIGIPSLATRNFTILQALVYNGTQEEVIGFRPRRLLHHIFKGVPDLELFERVRFQLSVSENAMRTVEASTETRGFINIQLPWQLPWKTAKKAWTRMTPVGVETLYGRVELGDYEVISSPVFFLNEQVKSIVISDIDDTIKDSKIAEATGFKRVLSGLFKGHFYGYDAIPGMASLYRDLAAKGALVIYITSTPYELAPFLLKFLKDHQFPEGPIFMRWLGYGRFGHKWRSLHRVLTNVDNQKVYLIGDSGEQDLQIYRRAGETSAFRDRIDKILIRHVPGTPYLNTLQEKEYFYREISQLREHLKPILE